MYRKIYSHANSIRVMMMMMMMMIVVYSILLVDLPPTFYLPKPLLVYGSMLLLSTLILSSYSIIVVMLGCDWGLRMVINITCLKIPGSGFIFAAFEYPSMTNKINIQYTSNRQYFGGIKNELFF